MATLTGGVDGIPTGVLGRDSIRELLKAPDPIVDRIRDVDAQLQPHGIDLTVEAVWQFAGRGALGPERRLPDRIRAVSSDGWYQLAPGSYVVTLYESIKLPEDLMALIFPRSTLLRCGGRLGTAVIDAGYQGQLEVLLSVENPFGLSLAAAATLCQVVFFPLSEKVEGYQGFYQGKYLNEDVSSQG
ncbi:MAG: deoxyuridine 5'-triphosphate nucleotidohydrolase [Chloroflexi bacterium]|nr:deoxyuridine 5'-triphosphate nucleotidohydrolase [Chloroflexota bacterium]